MSNSYNFNKILLNFFIISIALIIIYIIFKSINNPEKIFYYLKYLIFFILILTLLLILKIFKKKKIIANLNLIIISTVFIVYILEITSYYVINKNKNFQFNQNKKIAKKLNLPFDKRNLKEVYNDLKKDYENINFAYSGVSFNLNGVPIKSFGTISKSKIIMCNVIGKWIVYNSDRYGFNNPDELWDRNVEIVIIGDSYVQGHCVENKFNIRSVMSNISNKNILSLSMKGLGPMSELAIFKEYGLQKKPKDVILFFNLTDLDDLRIEKKNKILKEYLRNKNFSQNLKKIQSDIDINTKLTIKDSNLIKGDFRLNKFIKFFHLRDLIKSKMDYFSNPYHTSKINNSFERRSKNLDIFYNVVSEFDSLTKNYGGRFHIFIISSIGDFRGTEVEKNQNLKLIKKIYDFLNDKKINVYNVHDNFIENLDDPLEMLPFKVKDLKHENHYGKTGYKKMTEYVYNQIF